MENKPAFPKRLRVAGNNLYHSGRMKELHGELRAGEFYEGSGMVANVDYHNGEWWVSMCTEDLQFGLSSKSTTLEVATNLALNELNDRRARRDEQGSVTSLMPRARQDLRRRYWCIVYTDYMAEGGLDDIVQTSATFESAVAHVSEVLRTGESTIGFVFDSRSMKYVYQASGDWNDVSGRVEVNQVDLSTEPLPRADRSDEYLSRPEKVADLQKSRDHASAQLNRIRIKMKSILARADAVASLEHSGCLTNERRAFELGALVQLIRLASRGCGDVEANEGGLRFDCD